MRIAAFSSAMLRSQPDANDLKRMLDEVRRNAAGLGRVVDHGQHARLPHLDHLAQLIAQKHRDLVEIGRIARADPVLVATVFIVAA
ncbi:MAG: hypothetical protein U1F47_09755 [Hyphomicrobiales bacterium]